jgi:hypothetical protein
LRSRAKKTRVAEQFLLPDHPDAHQVEAHDFVEFAGNGFVEAPAVFDAHQHLVEGQLPGLFFLALLELLRRKDVFQGQGHGDGQAFKRGSCRWGKSRRDALFLASGIIPPARAP